MPRWSRAAVCALLISFVQCAVGQESLPTDAELRSGYCLPVLKWEIGLYTELTTAADSWAKSAYQTSVSEQAHRELSQLTTALNRLQTYMLPRLQYRDPMPLLGAQRRGEADVQAMKATTERCSTQCVAPGHSVASDDKERACVESCKDKDLVARINACANPSWLPF